MINMGKRSDDEYKCPYCDQTSSRLFNIRTHMQRKHRQDPASPRLPPPSISNANQSSVVNKPPNQRF
jgi:hypothetical protein